MKDSASFYAGAKRASTGRAGASRTPVRRPAFCLAMGVWLSALLLGALVAGGQQPPQGSGLAPLTADGLPSVVARIDGVDVTQKELIAQAEVMRGQAIRAGAGDPSQSQDFLPMVLDALISERLVFNDSKSRGVGPSEADVAQRVQEVIQAYGGEEGFTKALAAQGLNREYVQRQVTQTLSFDHMMEAEIKPTIEIGDEAVQGYYDRYKEQMRVPALYRVRRILKRLPPASDAEAQQAVRTQMESLRQQAVGGGDFAALAREHSDDQLTREQGGETPWFPLSGQNTPLDAQISKLEIGQISEIVELEGGLFLLRLEAHEPERLRTLEEAREEIVNALSAVEARQAIQDRVERLRSAANVEILM